VIHSRIIHFPIDPAFRLSPASDPRNVVRHALHRVGSDNVLKHKQRVPDDRDLSIRDPDHHGHTLPAADDVLKADALVFGKPQSALVVHVDGKVSLIWGSEIGMDSS
jgi:hypothetical protein